MRNVTLILDDGSRFHGKSFGFEKPVAGEVVFNTAMTGYPESLTDPSYAGQLMTLTYPLVGNYGVPPFTLEPNGLATFMESEHIHAEAIIVSDYSENYSHWNAVESLGDWLKREQIPGITGIDTRELTKVLREHGVMMGRIAFDDESDEMPEASYADVNYVDKVSCKEVIRYNEGTGKKKVLYWDGVRRVVHLQRPWRPRYLRCCRAAYPQDNAERETAHLRHLYGKPVAFQSWGRQDIQIEIRPPQP